MNVIDPDNPIPKYLQISAWIRELIQSGRYERGASLPSEVELSKICQVNRNTLRQAIAELTAAGMLRKEKGRGTFVCSQTSDYMLDVFYRLEGYDGSRELPKSRLLSFEKTLPTQEIASRLNLRTDEPIFSIHKVMTKNDIPAIYDEIAVPAKFFAYITEQTLVQYQSTLYEIFQKEYGLTVVQVKETIEACIPPEHVRNYLNMAVGEPALFIKRQGLLSREIPIETRYRYVASKVLRYFNSLDGW